MFGAAPMPAEAVRALSAALPGVELYELCWPDPRPPAATGPRTYGPPASGRYAIPSTEPASSPPTDPEVGGVLRGETIMKCYWNRPRPPRHPPGRLAAHR